MSKNQSVKTITLNDGRLIEDLTLTLDSRLTVFTGAMGAGKTSLLEGLAAALDKQCVCSIFINPVTYHQNCFDIGIVGDFATVSSLITTGKSFTKYSKGEQAIIGLYGSIANRLKCGPDEGRLLVLIDDLGHDLHPIWQHKILSCLLKEFPAVQFIITTTSPLVLTHVQPDSLFCLERKDQKIEIWQAPESYGKTSERILVDLQGLETTRPIEVKDCFDRFYRYLDDGKLASAKRELETGKDIIGHSIDTELTRMELRLRTVSRQNEVNPGGNEINHNYTLGK